MGAPNPEGRQTGKPEKKRKRLKKGHQLFSEIQRNFFGGGAKFIVCPRAPNTLATPLEREREREREREKERKKERERY